MRRPRIKKNREWRLMGSSISHDINLQVWWRYIDGVIQMLEINLKTSEQRRWYYYPKIVKRSRGYIQSNKVVSPKGYTQFT